MEKKTNEIEKTIPLTLDKSVSSKTYQEVEKCI